MGGTLDEDNSLNLRCLIILKKTFTKAFSSTLKLRNFEPQEEIATEASIHGI